MLHNGELIGKNIMDG